MYTNLSSLFTGEMFSTCARSLFIAARDLAHVLNISPVREKRMTNSNDTKKVVYSLQHTAEDINVVFFGQIFRYILTIEKVSVIFECGKGSGDY